MYLIIGWLPGVCSHRPSMHCCFLLLLRLSLPLVLLRAVRGGRSLWGGRAVRGGWAVRGGRAVVSVGVLRLLGGGLLAVGIFRGFDVTRSGNIRHFYTNKMMDSKRAYPERFKY